MKIKRLSFKQFSYILLYYLVAFSFFNFELSWLIELVVARQTHTFKESRCENWIVCVCLRRYEDAIFDVTFQSFPSNENFQTNFFLEIFPLVTSKLQVIKSLLRAHFLFNQQTTHKLKLGGPEKIYVFTFKCFIISILAKLDNLNIQETIYLILLLWIQGVWLQF